MQTFRVTVEEDGRVALPDTEPGQTLTVHVEARPETASDPNAGPIPEEEREAVKERVMRRAKKMREELPEPWLSSDHGDLLYDEDGLPK